MLSSIANKNYIPVRKHPVHFPTQDFESARGKTMLDEAKLAFKNAQNNKNIKFVRLIQHNHWISKGYWVEFKERTLSSNELILLEWSDVAKIPEPTMNIVVNPETPIGKAMLLLEEAFYDLPANSGLRERIKRFIYNSRIVLANKS